MKESKPMKNKFGDIYWRLSTGYYHREDGPAVIQIDGTKIWYKYGRIHREGGPAVEFKNILFQWYIEGVKYTEEEYKKEMRKCKIKDLKNNS